MKKGCLFCKLMDRGKIMHMSGFSCLTCVQGICGSVGVSVESFVNLFVAFFEQRFDG